MIAETVGAAISQLRYDDLPAEIVHAVKRSVLDTLGAALAGVGTEEVETVIRASRHWGSTGPSRVWGTNIRMAAPHAALVNGTAAHAREVDDFGGCGHSGAVVVPAVLAAAELSGASGADVVAAVAAGYEVAVRVTDALGGYHRHNARGWHGTGTAGTIGAAAGASRTFRLDDRETAWALGLGGTYTGGIWAFIVDGAMSKRLHAGKAAETGLVAAALAREGFTGPLAIFDDTWGSFLSLYGADLAQPDALVNGLGTDWSGIFRSGFKPYACCRGMHGALDAAFLLRAQANIKADDVQRVVVLGSEQTVRQFGKWEVSTLLDVQFSLPYSLALAFVVGRAGLDEYEAAVHPDARLTEFARRVEVTARPGVELTSPLTVEVHLRDGRILQHTVEYAKGDARNPMSDEELVEKFMALGHRALPSDQLKRIVDLIWQIDHLPDLSPLLAALGDLRA